LTLFLIPPLRYRSDLGTQDSSRRPKTSYETSRTSIYSPVSAHRCASSSTPGHENQFPHAIAKHTFDHLHAFMWWRVTTMVMHRHRMTWTALRRRLKGPYGWRPIVINEIELFPISSVTVTRYRWRGTTIPSAWPTENIEPAA
jgi:hypothetical protein